MIRAGPTRSGQSQRRKEIILNYSEEDWTLVKQDLIKLAVQHSGTPVVVVSTSRFFDQLAGFAEKGNNNNSWFGGVAPGVPFSVLFLADSDGKMYPFVRTASWEPRSCLKANRYSLWPALAAR
jgi:hypothetical protein